MWPGFLLPCRWLHSAVKWKSSALFPETGTLGQGHLRIFWRPCGNFCIGQSVSPGHQIDARNCAGQDKLNLLFLYNRSPAFRRLRLSILERWDRTSNKNRSLLTVKVTNTDGLQGSHYFPPNATMYSAQFSLPLPLPHRSSHYPVPQVCQGPPHWGLPNRPSPPSKCYFRCLYGFSFIFFKLLPTFHALRKAFPAILTIFASTFLIFLAPCFISVLSTYNHLT